MNYTSSDIWNLITSRSSRSPFIRLREIQLKDSLSYIYIYIVDVLPHPLPCTQYIYIAQPADRRPNKQTTAKCCIPIRIRILLNWNSRVVLQFRTSFVRVPCFVSLICQWRRRRQWSRWCFTIDIVVWHVDYCQRCGSMCVCAPQWEIGIVAHFYAIHTFAYGAHATPFGSLAMRSHIIQRIASHTSI